jgi:hypothetical protein
MFGWPTSRSCRSKVLWKGKVKPAVFLKVGERTKKKKMKTPGKAKSALRLNSIFPYYPNMRLISSIIFFSSLARRVMQRTRLVPGPSCYSILETSLLCHRTAWSQRLAINSVKTSLPMLWKALSHRLAQPSSGLAIILDWSVPLKK